MKRAIVYSDSFDPRYNLALEEHLLECLGEEETVLYLWRNRHTVVIGRNQNAWKECDHAKLEWDGGTLTRRSSGGGAVYHDLGNLNFTILLSRMRFNLRSQLEMISDVVKSFGLNPEISGRNDILLEGKKFSGHAYAHRGNRSLHHGTLLISVEFDAMMKYLRPSDLKLSAKSIESVRSRVVNLQEAIPGLEISHVKDRLVEAFRNRYTGEELESRKCSPGNLPLERLFAKYSSWKWTYGTGPDFDIDWEHRFSWGEVSVKFRLKDGIIRECFVFSDAMEPSVFPLIGIALQKVTFKKTDILSKLETLEIEEPEGREILNEIREFFSKNAK